MWIYFIHVEFENDEVLWMHLVLCAMLACFERIIPYFIEDIVFNYLVEYIFEELKKIGVWYDYALRSAIRNQIGLLNQNG